MNDKTRFYLMAGGIVIGAIALFYWRQYNLAQQQAATVNNATTATGIPLTSYPTQWFSTPQQAATNTSFAGQGNGFAVGTVYIPLFGFVGVGPSWT